MLATVVIPCLNARQTLERTLSALQRQTIREELHIIVIDNGSADGCLEMAAVLADQTARTPSRGSAHARNLGLKMTQTPFMLTLDADCRPANDDWAERHVSTLRPAARQVIASAGPLIPEPTSDWWANRAEVTPHSTFGAGRPQYAVGGNACYRTETLKRLGGFPLFAADDAALGVVARRNGYQYVWLPDAAIYHANPEGWRGYYRQMQKIGAYSAELAGPPSNWAQYLLDRIRDLSSSSRFLARGDFRQWVAGGLRAIAQTQGAVTAWRRMGWKARSDLVGSEAELL